MKPIAKLLFAAFLIGHTATSCAQTENPRGFYKLMSITGGPQDITPYPHDVYKICTDSVTMRLSVQNEYHFWMFRVDHSDPEVLNYTGERRELDATDKSTRIFDSNADHFTLKWWSTLPSSAYYPYNNWSYEHYQSGKYTEASKPVVEMLTSAPARDPKNPLIGTWQHAMEIEKMAGEGQKDGIDELKKVDNLKEVLAYLSQTDPNEPKQFQVYTPSHFFMMRMHRNKREMMGGYDHVTYNGKESVTAPGGEVQKIEWLTDDMFAIKQRMGNKVLYRVWERVADEQPLLSRVASQFLQAQKAASVPTQDSVLILLNGEQCRDISFDFIANGTSEDYEKFLNQRNLSLVRIDIWKNEEKKAQFRRKFGNWVKDVVEITARPLKR